MDFKIVPKVHPSKIAKLLFQTALFTIPFQISTIIWQPELGLSGHMNQFNNASIYITDLLIVLSALMFFPYRSHKKISLGNKPTLISLIVLTMLILVLNSTFPFAWLVLEVAIFWTTYILVINKISDKESIGRTLLISATIQSLIAIIQFLTQQSVGLYPLGEPNLLSDGIAKIDIGAQKFIRSYGTMPHPNILAGFLLIAMLLGKNKILKTICVIGLVLTFSRSAILSAMVCGTIYTISNFRDTIAYIKTKKIFISVVLITILAISTALLPQIKSRLVSTTEIEERLAMISPTIEMIIDNPLGIGWKNFTNEVQKYTTDKLLPWEYQPIHNIYLLATAELSILGTSLILFVIIYALMMTEDKKIKYGIIALAIIGIFDHYQYSIYQGEIISVILLSLASAYPLSRVKNPKSTSRVSPQA